MRSPYYGENTLLFGVSRTDRRNGAIGSFDRIGSEGIWFSQSIGTDLGQEGQEGPLGHREQERALRRELLGSKKSGTS